MSTKSGKIGLHAFHGDPKRFEVLANYIYQTFGGKVKTIADVAGGQGMLARIKEVVYSALTTPFIIIPCCNFWSRDEKLGRDALLSKIGEFYTQNNVKFEKIAFDFEGPKNVGLVTGQ